MQVKTISYKGKPYVEVAERVRQVHAQDIEFQVLESEPLEIIGRVVWKVTISVNGKIYKGSAEAKLTNAVPRSADETNPFECAETSALGRALAFAGFGTVDGIASYDEIARGQTPETLAREGQPTQSSQGRISASQVTSIKNLLKCLGREAGSDDLETMSADTARQMLATLSRQWQEVQSSKKVAV
jgi:hypothetical protein